MEQVIQQINSTNHMINYFDHISKVIVNLGHNKGFSSVNYSPILTYLKNKWRMIFCDIPEKDVSHSGGISLQRMWVIILLIHSSKLFSR